MSEGAAQAFRRVLHGECITCGQSAAEIAALRAKADAADRVRALCEQLPVWNTWRQRIEIALDGEP